MSDGESTHTEGLTAAHASTRRRLQNAFDGQRGSTEAE